MARKFYPLPRLVVLFGIVLSIMAAMHAVLLLVVFAAMQRDTSELVGAALYLITAVAVAICCNRFSYRWKTPRPQRGFEVITPSPSSTQTDSPSPPAANGER